MEESLPDLIAFADSVRASADRVLVLGMGGSSLAPIVFAESFPRRAGFPRLEILDSTDPEMVEAAAVGDMTRTIFVVSSKSGTTLEPNIFFDFFYDRLAAAVGDKAGERFVVVTDPGSKLETQARGRRVRRVFAGDPRIGGRYSALSNFGIVPAALAGVDVAELLRRARGMAARCRKDLSENPGARLGAAMGALALSGRDKLTFAVGSPVERFGMWIEQLIAESTGKEGKGVLPVEGEALGPPASYGADRFFAAVCRRGDRIESAVRPLTQAGHPTARFEIGEPLDLGAEMFRWEFATAVAGQILGIDPFDQPNVQEAKDRTSEILEGRSAAEGGAAGIDERALEDLLAGSFQGTISRSPPTSPRRLRTKRALNRIRLRVRDARRIATTVGFGPRFLHSTGQLHKGGPGTGVFLQITASESTDVPIPGRPYTFGQVLAAQAAGDLAALQSRGRRALRVHLSSAASGLSELDAAVERILRGSSPA